MAFQVSSPAVTDVEATIFTPAAETALLIRNTGSSTAFVGPSGSCTFPIEEGDLIAFGGIVAADVLRAKCAAGETTTLELIWTTA
jgi:hypothetical protein